MPRDESVRITIEKRGHVQHIGLNRPEKKNAFDRAMLRQLSDAYTAYEADEDARCALLFAHGDDFTTGLDLADVGPAVARGESLYAEGAIDPLDLIPPRRKKPVVCALHGWCLTVGVELSLACDIRLAADDTRFAQMEVQRGIMPFGGATLRFPRLTGWGNAMRWLLTGERFDAAEALRIGLVQEVCERDQLLERADAVATSVASQAPLAVQAVRAASRMAMEQGFDDALAGLFAEARGLMGTADAREGMMSFLQRREARFRGK